MKIRNLVSKPSERGQATILFAVTASVLMMVMGLAVEGGRMFVEFRRMQAAADMSALVGAQGLPCTISNTSCITTAETLACTYAANNGFSTCTPGGGVGASSSADVPPVSCSPYAPQIADYGNTNTNANCKQGQAPSNYTYVEVRLTQPITVPIFNVSFNMYAHAVARNGTTGPGDYTIAVLSPSATPTFYMHGSTNTVVVGDIISNNTILANAGGGLAEACGGAWFATSTISGVTTANSTSATDPVSPSFAPPDCVKSDGSAATADSPTGAYTNWPRIGDTYWDTAQPSSTNMPNCSACENAGYYYEWTSGNRAGGRWYGDGTTPQSVQITGSNTDVELFPGIYSSISISSGDTVYVNPGVYTLQGNITVHGDNMCVYGAPVCDHVHDETIPGYSGSTCYDATFKTGSSTYVDPTVWYYNCSPWGVWDTKLSRSGATGGGPSTTPPTFSDGTTPLNGVTFYMQSGNVSMNGNGDFAAAFPNPCPGTGTAFSAGHVPFPGTQLGEPSGIPASVGTYTYLTTSLAYQDGLRYATDVSANAQVYPNGDLTQAGECNNGLTVWNGEFPSRPNGQHLHFLIFADNQTTSVGLNGDSGQNWWGIVHTFPQNYAGYPGAPTTDYSSCTVSISGDNNLGRNDEGPPTLEGQVIADTADFGGNSSAEIFYRPGSPRTGPGTRLVE